MIRNKGVEFKMAIFLIAIFILMFHSAGHGDNHEKTGVGFGYTSYPFTQTVNGRTDSYSLNMLSMTFTNDSHSGWSQEATGFYMVEEDRADAWGGEFIFGKTFTMLPKMITGYVKAGPGIVRVNHSMLSRNENYDIRIGVVGKFGVQMIAPYLDKNVRLWVEYDFRDYPSSLAGKGDADFEFGNEFPNVLETLDFRDRAVLKQFRFGIKFLFPEYSYR
jgi:hypothetical protein